MTRFLIRRLLRAVLTILIVVVAAFVALRTTSDPAMVILGPDAPPDALAAFRKAWGLDQPLVIQFASYAWQILHGEFGKSMLDGADVLQKVTARVGVTLEIMVPALILGVVFGVALGTLAALNRGRWLDRLMMFGAVAGFSVPGFVLGLVLVLIFAVNLHWLPSGGNDSWTSALLPVFTLAVGWAAILARFTRSAMIEVLDQPYIRTGSAKGLLWHEVVLRHALPNASIPVVTMVGFMVGGLLAGAVVTESVFSWPGLGQLIVTSVTSRDVSVVQCVLVLVATTMVVSNMLVDLLYTWLDPRMKEAQA
ncbi:ABC transporter permease [Pseudooceanicola sp. CBS1P-1]|uniref:ABC transporter permease subunit n=1 Tax=Pseudooceanicola albus TaxID=2692189 RepID=A0A6L7G2S0_9RHOB|nr:MULTISPECIES: ABC transporter permease [Pseudooceanicola]MBT9382331.1 ABC transporter permease [Pseudooceanicola endophyticus]MXN16873.1 ABC transporter permease subunit [Pseudooceanicola albus]